MKFAETPVIVSTATIGIVSLDQLCKAEYLRDPVLINGTVDRRNVKLSLEKYKTVPEKMAKFRKWSALERRCTGYIHSLVSENYMARRSCKQLSKTT